MVPSTTTRRPELPQPWHHRAMSTLDEFEEAVAQLHLYLLSRDFSLSNQLEVADIVTVDQSLVRLQSTPYSVFSSTLVLLIKLLSSFPLDFLWSGRPGASRARRTTGSITMRHLVGWRRGLGGARTMRSEGGLLLPLPLFRFSLHSNDVSPRPDRGGFTATTARLPRAAPTRRPW